jgi:ribonuclease E
MIDEHSADANGRLDPFHSTPSFLSSPEPKHEPSAEAPRHGDRAWRVDDEHALPAGAETDAGAPASTVGAPGGERRRRRRGSRGGRRRRAPGQLPLGDSDGARPVQADDAAPRDEQFAVPEDRVPQGTAPEPDRVQPGQEAGGDQAPRRGRRRRGGRRHRGSKGGDAARPEQEPRPAGDVRVAVDAPPRRARSDGQAPVDRGAGGGTGGGPGAPKRRRRRRGGRGRGVAPGAPVEIEAIPGEEDDLPELPELPSDAVALPPTEERVDGSGCRSVREERGERSERGERGDGRRRRKRVEPDRETETVARRPLRKNLILVNAGDPEEQRVAVVEDGRIVDFQMTVRTENSVVNDIYRGRVVNLETAIGAAFVDFGQGKNGFLHTSDVLSAYGEEGWSLDKLLSTSVDPDEWEAGSEKGETEEPAEGAAPEEGQEAEPEAERTKAGAGRKRRPERTSRFRARPRLPITDLLKKGEMVAVQVTKDAIGDKGPTLTTYISIPGRYLVLMPSMSRTGVSRKIEDEKERKRLKRILEQLEVPPGMGVIVRTAGVGRTAEDLKRDLDYLTSAWENFARRLRSGNGPAPLYQESDIAIRTVRDLFTSETEAVLVDDPEVHRQILEFTRRLMPEAEERVKLHEGPKPLFQTYGIEPDFERLFARRIELPSGGSIVFDQAEALVAIDVNSGRTRGGGHDFEEIALKTNVEAAPEIARQIRLRDLGGILVVDFIDMMKAANIRKVEKAFADALAMDRARSKIGRISQFGLLELTRQRLGPGISRKVFTTCVRCRGTGRVRTVESRAAAVLRRLGSALTLKGFAQVEVKAHPEVTSYLKRECSELLRALEYRHERQIRLVDSPEQHEDSVLRYLRTDGREVRPGGRRKR